MDYAPIIVAVIVAAGGIFGSWLTVRAGRTKNSAEATSVLTGIAMSLISPLQRKQEEMDKEIARMERKIAHLEKENALLHKWAQLLYSQVVETGLDPIPFEFARRLEDGR